MINQSFIKLIAAVVLIVLGLVMIFLGQRAGILPPTVTGLGFFAIAAVFLSESRNRKSGGDH